MEVPHAYILLHPLPRVKHLELVDLYGRLEVALVRCNSRAFRGSYFWYNDG